MVPALRGTNAFDAPVNGVPDDVPKDADADGEEKRGGGGDARKLELNDWPMEW